MVKKIASWICNIDFNDITCAVTKVNNSAIERVPFRGYILVNIFVVFKDRAYYHTYLCSANDYLSIHTKFVIKKLFLTNLWTPYCTCLYTFEFRESSLSLANMYRIRMVVPCTIFLTILEAHISKQQKL